MDDLFLTVSGWIITGLFGLIGWLIKLVFDKIKEVEMANAKLRDGLDAHKLYVAQVYTTRSEIERIQSQIIDFLRRIEDKLERKADKE